MLELCSEDLYCGIVKIVSSEFSNSSVHMTPAGIPSLLQELQRPLILGGDEFIAKVKHGHAAR